MSVELLRGAFDQAVASGGSSGAERLCQRCVDLLEVDGAAISLMSAGKPWGTLGASGELSRPLDELQFTYGRGPCLDAVNFAEPVLVANLGRADESRWPAFSAAVPTSKIRGVFALPVAPGAHQVGALDLYRYQTRAAQPTGAGWQPAGRQGCGCAAAWQRVEVYQATGMIMVQLDVSNAEALVRLRGYAFTHGMTATEVARAVIAGTVVLADHTGGAGEPDHKVRS